ncbi:hypothetical protein RCL_jg18289.t1 [Rhizophagus clarus]|uniref:Uncharacterized protein n=1 Tax=Rhizophagus clarus TaxID=94130 RepID=A0A8H3LGE5_9GLOM|nr:hypothetical protein RCL_jg18289.t1 [Rhizophagus clarus]
MCEISPPSKSVFFCQQNKKKTFIVQKTDCLREVSKTVWRKKISFLFIENVYREKIISQFFFYRQTQRESFTKIHF